MLADISAYILAIICHPFNTMDMIYFVLPIISSWLIWYNCVEQG